MGCGTSFVKYVLFFFNLLVSLFGLATIGIGVAVLLKYSPITNELKEHVTVAPWVFIIIGSVMFVIAFFGCCGAIRESHCMVVTYSIFLLVIIIVQVVLAVLMFTYSDSLKGGLVNSVQRLYDKTRSDSKASEVFNNLELQLSCCGAQGPQDYLLSVPSSCCNPDPSGGMHLVQSAIGCTAINSYQGCRSRVAELYDTWNKTIAGVAIGIACVEVVGALFALCLANSIRNMDRRYA